MSGFKTFNPRSLRTAEKIHHVLSEGLSRGIIGRSRVLQDGRAVTIDRVEVTSDLQVAKVYWEPMTGDTPVHALRAALERKRGFLSSYVNSFLRQRMGAKLHFVMHEAAVEQADAAELPRRLRAKVERRSAAAQRLDDALERLRLTDEAREARMANHQLDAAERTK